MKIRRRGTATWDGTVPAGSGSMAGNSGALDVPFSLESRVAETPQSSPEELIGAAHAGCFSMSLANLIEQAGLTPGRVETMAAVTLEQQDAGFAITTIKLTTKASAEGLDAAQLDELAEQAKATCPVSKALAGTAIELEATVI